MANSWCFTGLRSEDSFENKAHMHSPDSVFLMTSYSSKFLRLVLRSEFNCIEFRFPYPLESESFGIDLKLIFKAKLGLFMPTSSLILKRAWKSPVQCNCNILYISDKCWHCSPFAFCFQVILRMYFMLR